MAYVWIFYALLADACWGIGYALQTPLSQVLLPYSINVIYGAVISVVGMIVLGYQGRLDNLFELGDGKLALIFLFYLILFVVGSFVSLYGFSVALDNPGGFVALSSIYPLVTLFVSYVFMGQRNIAVLQTILGVLLIVAGIVTLSMTKS